MEGGKGTLPPRGPDRLLECSQRRSPVVLHWGAWGWERYGWPSWSGCGVCG